MNYEERMDEANPVYLDEAKRLMYKIVKMVYVDRMTQREVVKTLKKQGTFISIPSVSRLLQKAYDEGIVTYRLNFPRIFKIEDELRDRFGLVDVRVIYLPDSEPRDVSAALGPVAAEYLQSLLASREEEWPRSIGIAGGMTIFQMIDSLPEGLPWDVSIYPISIESLDELEITSAVNAALLRQKLPESKAYSIQLPISAQGPIEETEKEIRSFLNYKYVSRIFSEAQQADVIIVGIGDFSESSRIAVASELAGEDTELLRSKGVVGDIGLTAFDLNGKVVDCQLNRRNFGVKAERFKELIKENRQDTDTVQHRIIAVAGGRNKQKAILGALCGRYCNVLITDEVCASYVLENAEAMRDIWMYS